MEIKTDFSIVLMVLLANFIFGVGYNLLIGWLERKRYLEGYASLAVAGGVLATIGLTAFISWTYALLALGSFFCSGLPMVIGSIGRYMRTRAYEQELLREEASRYHWKTELPSPLDTITESMERLAANITHFFCHPIHRPSGEGKDSEQ